MSYQSVNPYSGESLNSFDEFTDHQLEAGIASAASCFETWRTLTFSERGLIVHRAANLLRERVEEFARLVTMEMGKLFVESCGEVRLSADILD